MERRATSPEFNRAFAIATAREVIKYSDQRDAEPHPPLGEVTFGNLFRLRQSTHRHVQTMPVAITEATDQRLVGKQFVLGERDTFPRLGNEPAFFSDGKRAHIRVHQVYARQMLGTGDERNFSTDRDYVLSDMLINDMDRDPVLFQNKVLGAMDRVAAFSAIVGSIALTRGISDLLPDRAGFKPTFSCDLAYLW